MGRGAQAETRKLADQQLAQQNALNDQFSAQNQSLQSTSAAGYQNLLAHPGFSDAQKSATTNQSMGALASTFAALASNAANRRTRTRNSAGYGESLDNLARLHGQQAAGLAQQNQFAFADQSKQDQLAALQGLGGLYGVNSTLLGRTLGIPANLLDVRTKASQSSNSGVGYVLGQGLGALGRIFGG